MGGAKVSGSFGFTPLQSNLLEPFSKVMFNTAIKACANAGDQAGAERYLEEMRQRRYY